MTRIFVLREFDEQRVKLRGVDFVLRKSARKELEDRISVDFHNLKPFVSALDMDLAYVASSLFLAEGLQRMGKVDLDQWICFLLTSIEKWNRPGVKYLIQDILSFMIKSRPAIRCQKAPRKRLRIREVSKPKNVESVTLFSGGIDSLSGILNVHTNQGPTAGVFVSHAKLSSRVENIAENFLGRHGIQIYRVDVQRQKPVLQQLRGFLYLSIGAIVSKILGTKKIFISETGPVMYQPVFVPTDEVTLTTHPTLIELTKELLKEIYGIRFEFYEPFEDLTKAEVIALCPEKEAIPFTNSCISTRFAYSNFSHCGICYGCLVRRLSSLVAGVVDANYGRDILVQEIGERKNGGWPGERIKVSNLGDLSILLRFARDVLEDKLDDFVIFKIKEFRKEKLFRRFALDVFAGIFILYTQKKVGRNSHVQNFFQECKKDGVVSKDILENRINEVREQKYKPNFTFKL